MTKSKNSNVYHRTFHSFDKVITEKNAQGWADWCGGELVDNNGNVEVEFTNKYNQPQRVKIGGVILSYTDKDSSIKYIGTSDENLNRV